MNCKTDKQLYTCTTHRRRSWSGWSGFGQTTFIIGISKNCACAQSVPITTGPLQKSFLRPCNKFIIVMNIFSDCWPLTPVFKKPRTSTLSVCMPTKDELKCNVRTTAKCRSEQLCCHSLALIPIDFCGFSSLTNLSSPVLALLLPFMFIYFTGTSSKTTRNISLSQES